MIKRIYEALFCRDDPYVFGRGSHGEFFHLNPSFVVQTEGGYWVRFTVHCLFRKKEDHEFRAARMLEAEKQTQLGEAWLHEKLIPKLRALRCSFKFVLTPPIGPVLCRYSKDEPDGVFLDWMCSRTRQELMESKLFWEKNGCLVQVGFEIKVEVDEVLIKENYAMLKSNGPNDIESSTTFKDRAESMVVALLNHRFELERAFQHLLTNQEHKSDSLVVKTRLAGRVVEISWKFQIENKSQYQLRGYRNHDGFTSAEYDLSSCGACVVETQRNGSLAQSLEAGKEYFYTFLLTTEAPVYAKTKPVAQDVLSLLRGPVVEGSETKVVEALRFSVRAPTEAEILRVDQMIEGIKNPVIDPKREKIDLAIKELSSFVEFDDSISEWEKALTKQIKSKKIPAAEKRDKIERLKGVIESLRVRNE